MTIEPAGDEFSFVIKEMGDGGADIFVRPIHKEDRHLLQLGFDQLSERSRYFRFLMRRAALTEEELDFLTARNTDDHVALGALDLAVSPGRPVGIARYVRNEDEPDTAEIAITISDRYQGRGLGTMMIAALAFRAAQTSLTAFTALVHKGNSAMLHILLQLGGEELMSRGIEVNIRVPVFKDPANYPDNKRGDKMREVFAALS